jgi:hypothetical protein
MFEHMRQLHRRGAANRGICVDADGATLGPECILVHRSAKGYRGIGRDEAEVLQQVVLDDDREPDWLFQQSRRIANALDEGEIALAQIYGLYIPIGELNDRQLEHLAAIRLAKAGFNLDEPRLPKGDPHGGEWTSGEDDSEGTEATDIDVPSDSLSGRSTPPCGDISPANASDTSNSENIKDPHPIQSAAIKVPTSGNKDDCIEYCMERTAPMREWSGDPFWACLRACQGFWTHPLFPEFG